jgi:hypothetical protein
MTLGIVLAMDFGMLLTALLWAVIAVLNFWIWSKAKANPNLLMMIGAGWFALMSLFATFGTYLFGDPGWGSLLGTAFLAIGFYLSVKPMVAANIANLQAKVKDTMSKKGGGAPPATP